MAVTYSIARTPAAKQKWLVCAGLALGTSLVLWVVVGVLAKQPGQALWLLGGIGALVVAVFVFFDRSKHVRFEIEDRELRVRGDVFGRRFPLASLHLENAAVLDLTKSTEYRPKWRVFGTSMPGYDAGEFSLRNGKSAVIFLSDRRRVLSIPMKNGNLLMLSCEDPPKLLSALVRETRPETVQPSLF